jgi:hypothetical protein
MNHPARLFAALSTAFAFDAASELVERLAAEFASAVALDVYLHHAPLLLAVVTAERPESLENLRLFLQSYGLTLVARPLKSRHAWLVGVRLARPSDALHPKGARKVTERMAVVT